MKTLCYCVLRSGPVMILSLTIVLSKQPSAQAYT